MQTKCLTIKDYILFKEIGKGSFGEVFLAKKGNQPQIYAVKRIDIKSPKNQKMLKYLNYEISILLELKNHPNIIKLIDFIQSVNHYYVVMEYCNGGSLSDCLEKCGGRFPVKIIQYLMIQIVNGLKYIHSHKVIHRDLKLDNILINFKNESDKLKNNLLASEVKIIDFGLAIKLGPEECAKTFIGSPIFMDPKILGVFQDDGKLGELQEYDEKADIWSLGVICYQIFTGKSLYNAENIKQLVKQAKLGDYKIPINIELSNEIIAFLNSMLQYYGEFRLSAEELSQHDFLVKDVNEFTMVNLDLLSDKIENNEIKINSINNATIVRVVDKNHKKKKDQPKGEEEPANNKGPLLRFQLQNTKSKENSNNISQMNSEKEIFSSKQLFSKKSNQNFQNLDNEIIEYEKIEKLLNNVKQKEKIKEKEIYNKLNTQKMTNNKNDKWEKYIEELLFEYKEAKNYFEENNLKNQEQKIYNKYIQIEKAKNTLKSEKLINNIGWPVKPEDIYGCSSKERNDKFNELINKYQSDKYKIEVDIKINEKSIISDDLQKLEIDKIKLQKLNFIISEFKKRYNNIWVPAPDFIKEIKKCKVEKISYINCDFKFKIQVKKLDNKKENINFNIFLKINEKKNFSKEIKINYEENFFEEWFWTLNSNEWTNIDNNSDSFIFCVIFDKNSLITKLNKNIYLKIGKVLSGQCITFNLNISTQSNGSIPLHIRIKPILPVGQKFYALETKKLININKIFPAFFGKSPFTNNFINTMMNNHNKENEKK